MRFVVIFPPLIPNKDDCPFSASLSILFPSGSFIFHGGISLVACYSCRKQGVTHTKSLHYLAMVHLYIRQSQRIVGRAGAALEIGKLEHTTNTPRPSFSFQTEEKTIDVGGKKNGSYFMLNWFGRGFLFLFPFTFQTTRYVPVLLCLGYFQKTRRYNIYKILVSALCPITFPQLVIKKFNDAIQLPDASSIVCEHQNAF